VIKYFVILGSYDGLAYPLLEAPRGPRLAFFDTLMAGTKAAEDHPLGHAYGYRVMALSDPGATPTTDSA
jgi:hypothetical protein